MNRCPFCGRMDLPKEPKKNYIDRKGVYHNIQNFTLAQIYDSGVEQGYRLAKMEEEKYG